MKFKLYSVVCCVPFLLVSTAQAVPTVISDGYIGAAATSPSWAGADVIGAIDKFDIDRAEVELSSSQLTMSIFSSYFDNVGQYKTELGDLFISSDGYHPFGSAPYLSDNAANGENWEYALVFSNHGEAYSGNNAGVSMLGTSGQVSLYSVADSNGIVYSSGSGGVYRGGQEVQLDVGTASALATGTWSIHNRPGIYDELLFQISFVGTPLENLSVFSFHYAMTCANDVIEGSVSTPEPSSVLLLLGGLGYLPLGRRLRA